MNDALLIEYEHPYWRITGKRNDVVGTTRNMTSDLNIQTNTSLSMKIVYRNYRISITKYTNAGCRMILV